MVPVTTDTDSSCPRSLQRGADAAVFRVQRGAHAVDDGDDGDADAGGDQAIFDRGGAGLVVQESCNQSPHSKLLSALEYRRILPAPCPRRNLWLEWFPPD